MKNKVKLLFVQFVLILSVTCNEIKASNAVPIENFKISVQGYSKSITEVLSLYIQMKSESGSEKKAGEWFKNVCAENGLYVSQFGDKDGNYNFSASLFPLSKRYPNIILLNHIDVVNAGDLSAWIHPPYEGYIGDSEIWGRGAFDNKGAAIMQLFSILQFKAEYEDYNLPYNVSLLAVSCEETSCEGGIKYVIEHHLTELNPVVVIGEGATEINGLLENDNTHHMFGISIAHKRPVWLELKLSIPTNGHGSVTPLAYANKEMTHALSRLLSHEPKAIFNQLNKEILKNLGNNEKGFKKFVLKHPRLFKPLIIRHLRSQPEIFALFSNTVTITSLNSHNETVNKIPNSVTVLLDCRLMPSYSNKRFIRHIKRRLRNRHIKIKVLAQSEKMIASDPNNTFYQHLSDAVQTVFPKSKVIPIILPNFNDVGIFRSKGIPGYSIIPVELSKNHIRCVHAENERIPIKAMYQGTETYQIFIERCMNVVPYVALK